MAFYQKAVQLDPAYAVAYNDLGIVCEAKGFMERAEESYLQAIKVNPNYLSAYTNLALVYENKRDLQKAAFYWKRRSELGSQDDPWTEKAKKRTEDIELVLSKTPWQDEREQEVVGLLKETSIQKSILKKDDSALARKHFEKAKQSYDKQDYATAIKEALDALQLDPANPEIDEFIAKVQTRALSK
jgi:tetratricopeptide (TPR) repeat protein